MIEYHGWVSICLSIDGENEDKMDMILSEIESIFEKETTLNEFYPLLSLNYSNMLYFGGAHNHGGGQLEKVLSLYSKVGDMAPGSFGILYYWDNEDKVHSNEFVVYRMAQGKVKKLSDPFLSPCNPTIEI